jgi:hypothetical protein
MQPGDQHILLDTASAVPAMFGEDQVLEFQRLLARPPASPRLAHDLLRLLIGKARELLDRGDLQYVAVHGLDPQFAEAKPIIAQHAPLRSTPKGPALRTAGEGGFVPQPTAPASILYDKGADVVPDFPDSTDGRALGIAHAEAGSDQTAAPALENFLGRARVDRPSEISIEFTGESALHRNNKKSWATIVRRRGQIIASFWLGHMALLKLLLYTASARRGEPGIVSTRPTIGTTSVAKLFGKHSAEHEHCPLDQVNRAFRKHGVDCRIVEASPGPSPATAGTRYRLAIPAENVELTALRKVRDADIRSVFRHVTSKP